MKQTNLFDVWCTFLGQPLSALRIFLPNYLLPTSLEDTYFPFSTTIGNRTRQVGFSEFEYETKRMCVGSAGDCHCLPVWLCSHNKNTGSKWTTKHPLSGPARLTRIYWPTRRNEKEIFLTPTAAKGTECKFNNTLCDQPPHCTDGEPFRHTIFCHYRNLIVYFSIF